MGFDRVFLNSLTCHGLFKNAPKIFNDFFLAELSSSTLTFSDILLHRHSESSAQEVTQMSLHC